MDFLKQEQQHKFCNFFLNLQSGQYKLLSLCLFCTKNVFIAHLQLNIHFYFNCYIACASNLEVPTAKAYPKLQTKSHVRMTHGKHQVTPCLCRALFHSQILLSLSQNDSDPNNEITE